MLNSLRKFFTGISSAGNGSANSKSLAKSRLSFVLVQDRTGLSPEDMTKFKKELVGVIERYFEIDENGFDISYKRETESTTLLINSPVVVKRLKSRSERKGSKDSEEKTSEESAAAAT